MKRNESSHDDARDASQLAAQYGLTKVGQRPSLGSYVKDLWVSRSFLATMARARSYSKYQRDYLGQAWTVLDPLLLGGVYYLVFGVLLNTTRGVDNFPAFLVIGIFIFFSFSTTITAGANSIINNLTLVRAISFPRAVLPLSIALAEMLRLLPAIFVMFLIVIFTGQAFLWTWLLVPAALILLLMFTSGICLMSSRIVVAARDLRNLIPVGVRLLRYVSGVFFSVSGYGSGAIGWLMEYQPVALFLTLFRACLMDEISMTPGMWLAASGWSVAFFIVGLVVFWSAEDKYGRE